MADHKAKDDHDITNMAGIKTAIVNGEQDRLQDMLTGIHLDELNKGYLIELARMNNNEHIVSIIEKTPTKP